MKPDRTGVWEWFEEDGTKRLVAVWDVARKIPGNTVPYLRVSWWGGYYNVNDETDPEHPEYDEHTKAEWSDRWGNYVGQLEDFNEDQIYDMPTPEQREEILKNYKLTQL